MDPNLQRLLADCSAGGVRVELYAIDDACPICRRLAGTIYDATEAPDVPIADCENEHCRCDYLPVV